MIDITHEEAVNNFEDFRCRPSQERLAREGPARRGISYIIIEQLLKMDVKQVTHRVKALSSFKRQHTRTIPHKQESGRTIRRMR